MKKLRICIDMDDTIEYLLPAWLRWLENQYNFKVSPEAIKSWEITQYFPHLTEEQIYQPLTIPEFWDTVNPMSDAITYIPKLVEDGHKVYICTATDYRIAPEKFDRCLFKHFPFIDKHNVITCHNKQMINCDIMVDDAIHNLIDGNYIGLLIYSPSNREVDITPHKYIKRVYDWKEIYNFITELSEIAT